MRKVPRRAYFLNFNATLRSTRTEMLNMRYFNPTQKFYCRHELEFSTPQTYSGLTHKRPRIERFQSSALRGIFFTIASRSQQSGRPIWTFAIRLRLFIYRGEGPILLHIIEIYFIVHRTALRFSQSDTRNLTFHLIDVWMS